jgi:hypothetical protein
MTQAQLSTSKVILLILVGIGVVISLLSYNTNLPARAKVNELRIGYFSDSQQEWVFTSRLPANLSRLMICGTLNESNPAELMISISNPDQEASFVRLDEHFYEVEPGEFCETVLIYGSIAPGVYRLQIIDSHDPVAEMEIEFVEPDS